MASLSLVIRQAWEDQGHDWGRVLQEPSVQQALVTDHTLPFEFKEAIFRGLVDLSLRTGSTRLVAAGPNDDDDKDVAMNDDDNDGVLDMPVYRPPPFETTPAMSTRFWKPILMTRAQYEQLRERGLWKPSPYPPTFIHVEGDNENTYLASTIVDDAGVVVGGPAPIINVEREEGDGGAAAKRPRTSMPAAAAAAEIPPSLVDLPYELLLHVMQHVLPRGQVSRSPLPQINKSFRVVWAQYLHEARLDSWGTLQAKDVYLFSAQQRQQGGVSAYYVMLLNWMSLVALHCRPNQNALAGDVSFHVAAQLESNHRSLDDTWSSFIMPTLRIAADGRTIHTLGYGLENDIGRYCTLPSNLRSWCVS